MKSVLISIQPKWCELIASGKKTVEVRKTKPKLETPFRVYIYCTKNKEKLIDVIHDGDDVGDFIHRGKPNFIKTYDKDWSIYGVFKGGKVIGEFVCDKVTKAVEGDYGKYLFESETQVDVLDLLTYATNKNGELVPLYGWHISDLVIYNKPRELSEFKTICRNAYCQDYWGDATWFCKDGYSSCAVTDKEREFPYNEECIYFDCPSVGGESCEYEDYAYCNCNGLKPITRPPQSWCYVERKDYGT